MVEPKKLTRNQEVVMAALRAAEHPLSAYQILDVEIVRDNGLKAPLTVYRALDKLIALGLVHRIESLSAFVLCDHEPHSEPAAFMICQDCRSTIEFSTRAVNRSIDLTIAELGRDDFDRNLRDFKAAQALQGKERDAAMFQLMPAHQARNHATTAEAPAEK